MEQLERNVMPEYLRVFANMAGGRRYFFADPSRMEAQVFILEARLDECETDSYIPYPLVS